MNNLTENRTASAMADDVKTRFREFVELETTSKVAERAGVAYQVIYGAAFGEYRPSLETIFKVKIAYGYDFDEVYVLTGIKRESSAKYRHEDSSPHSKQTDIPNTGHNEELDFLREKIKYQEITIKDLKSDKDFLQALINKQQ